MATLELTIEEGNALMQLIDVAVKSGGLATAQAAVVLSEKIKQSFQVPAQEVKEVVEEKEEVLVGEIVE